VLGVIQLQSSKPGRQASEGTLRKIKALEMAQIPVWQIAGNDLPDAKALREMVMPQLQAAEQHSQQHSVQHAESEWEATRMELREATVPAAKKKPEPANDRWNQPWPNEEARSSVFLDEMGMIEVPPLKIKGSGRAATG
jgi:hypothetical protein